MRVLCIRQASVMHPHPGYHIVRLLRAWLHLGRVVYTCVGVLGEGLFNLHIMRDCLYVLL